jgi:fatty acid amide hydrolase
VAQLLAFVETDNPVYGRTNNPRNHERSCGGSSGGEGAIIGAGASPLGLGTDIGGSCWVPAAWCGTVGLKPTAGRTPDTGRGSFAISNQAITSVVGVLGPTVADVALGLEVINGGREPADLGQPRLGDPAAVDPARLTVAVFAHDGTFTASPAARRAVTEATDQLEAAGVRLLDWTPPGAEALALLYASLGADLAAAWKPLVTGTTVDRRIKQLLTLSRVPGPVLSGASGLLDRLGQESLAAGARLFATPGSIAGYFTMAERVADFRAATLAAAQAEGIDAVLSPAVGMAAIRHGASYDLALMGAYTALYNALGWPAGVVPYTTVRPGEETDRAPGKDRVMKVAAASEAGSAGLPVAVQVAAPPWREDVVLALLSRLEQPLRAATH